MPERTPSQTVGPYLHLGLAPADYKFREVFSATLADPGIPGTHIRIEGRNFGFAALAAVVAGFWSLMSGTVVVMALQAIGHLVA